MSRRHSVQYGSGDVLILEDIPGEGVTRARGATVPSDGATGYAIGCEFKQTDGVAGTVSYVNEGSNTSADFNASAIDEAVALLDGVTAGTLAAGKAWTSDASLDTTMPTGGLLTVQSGGAITANSGSTLTLSGAVVQAPVFVILATTCPYLHGRPVKYVD